MIILVALLFGVSTSLVTKNQVTEKWSGELHCLERVGNMCLRCALSFPDEVQMCKKPTTEIKDCLSYESDGKCRQCKYKRKLNDQRDTCEKVSINECLIQTDNYCLACDFKKLAIDGKCEGNPKTELQQCKIAFLMRNEEQCLLCEHDYTVRTQFNQNICFEMEKNEGCEQAIDKYRCRFCKFNFFMTDEGKCEEQKEYHVDIYAYVSVIPIWLLATLTLLQQLFLVLILIIVKISLISQSHLK